MNVVKKISFLIIFLIPVLVSGGSGQEFEYGKIIPRIQTLADPDQSYALYLPSAFSRDRSWPLLLTFEPGARSEIPLTLFRPAAEKYGYIVVCSNNLKNGPWQPILKAMKAMWGDVLNRFPVDFNRVYATGFSGGARASAAFPHITGQRLAGIIACGAGLPPAVKAEQVKPSYYHGIVGLDDYNYKEMVRLDRELEAAGADHFIQFIINDHNWPPEEICLQAVEFMEVRAMRNGTKSRDQKVIGEVYQRGLEHLLDIEKTMNPYYAYRFSQYLAGHFQDLVDTAQLNKEIIRLEASRDLKKFRREEEKLNHEELVYIRRFIGVYTWIKNYRQKRIDMKKIARELDLDTLVREARRTQNRYRSAMAGRLLHELVVKSNQEGAAYLSKGDLIRAEIFYGISARAYEKGVHSYYNLARIHALKNSPKKAIDFLKKVVENGRSRGVTDFSWLIKPGEFETLSDHPEFSEIMNQMGLKNSD